ncbi:hypothetical protein ACJX0J_025390, partial [Zea mays]
YLYISATIAFSVITLYSQGVGNAINIHFRVFDLVFENKLAMYFLLRVLSLAPQTLQVCPVIIVNRKLVLADNKKTCSNNFFYDLRSAALVIYYPTEENE